MNAIEFLKSKNILDPDCSEFIVTFSDSQNENSFDFVKLMEEYKSPGKKITPKERLDYIDIGLRVNNIELDEAVKVKFLKIVDIIDKEKGTRTLDQMIVSAEL